MKFKVGDIVVLKKYIKSDGKAEKLEDLGARIRTLICEKIPLVIKKVKKSDKYPYSCLEKKPNGTSNTLDFQEEELTSLKIKNWKEYFTGE